MCIEYQQPKFPKAPAGQHVCRIGDMHDKSRKILLLVFISGWVER